MALASSDDEWGAFEGGGGGATNGGAVAGQAPPAGPPGVVDGHAAQTDAGSDDEFGEFEGGSLVVDATAPPPPPPPVKVVDALPAASSLAEHDSFGDFEGADVVSRLAGVGIDGDEGVSTTTTTTITPAPWTPPAGWTEAPAAIAVADLVPTGQALPEDLFAEPVVEDRFDEGPGTADHEGADAEKAPPVDEPVDADPVPSPDVHDESTAAGAVVVEEETAAPTAPANDRAASPPPPAPSSDDDEWAEFEGGAVAEAVGNDAVVDAGAVNTTAPDADRPASTPPAPDDDDEWAEFEGGGATAAEQEASAASPDRSPSPPPVPHPSTSTISFSAAWAALLNAAAVELEAATGAWRAVCAAAADRAVDPTTHPALPPWLAAVGHVLAVVRVVETAAEGSRAKWAAGRHAAALESALSRAAAAVAADASLVDAAATVDDDIWHETDANDATATLTCALTGVRAPARLVDASGAIASVGRLWRARVLGDDGVVCVWE